MFVKERFVIDADTQDTIRGMTPNFGYNGFGEFLFYRTYSREICHYCRGGLKYNPELNLDYCPRCPKFEYGQETWHDVVLRVISGVFSIRKDWYLRNYIPWEESFWQHYARHMAISMFNMEWLPPGRGLWAMGTDFVFERGSMALNNCGLTVIGDDVGEDINWMMDALMCGVGVGFMPTRNDDLRVYNPRGTYDFVIPDTREGWCDSTKQLINSFLQPGQPKPRLIYDKIRAKGTPIRGFGGICSGPDPLIRFHQQIEEFMEMYATLPWYDSVLLKTDIANCTGCCVVAGNVRRSAELCAGEIDDILDLKDYEKYPYREDHGWMSNNSALLSKDEDFERLGELAVKIINNGEPGYINVRNLPFGRIGKEMGELRFDRAIAFNPCQIADSKLLTPTGIRRLGNINVGDQIWSECGWTTVVKKWSTGTNSVYAYHTTAGVFIGTENHRVVYEGMKIEVKDAPGIDVLRGPVPLATSEIDSQTVMDGLVLGDGTDYHGKIALLIGANDNDYFKSEIAYLIKKQSGESNRYYVETWLTDLPLTYHREVPEKYLYGDSVTVRSLLRGLFSANGSVVGNRVQLKTTSFKLMRQVQMMLSSIGIKSYYTTNKSKIVSFANGDYNCKESYDLAISDDRERFMHLIGFIQEYKQIALASLVNDIKKLNKPKETFEIIHVEYLGEEETFDITVDNPLHTYWTQCCNVSNCGEQPLENKELCTLVETCPTRCDGPENWYRACEYATVYASTVTLLPTHRPETNAVMLRNRRIGVGIVDISGWQTDIGITNLTKYLRTGYKRVVSTNRWVNTEAGIPLSLRHTTMKPGGTTPKLPGLRSGWQWPTFGYTLRRVRVAENSPVHPLLCAAGVPHEPDVFSAGTDVFEWPIDQSNGGRVRSATQVSIWEQAAMLVLLQREWSDNAVSNTLYFRPRWNLMKDIDIGDTIYGITDEILESIRALDVGIYDMTDWAYFLNTQEDEMPEKFRLILEYDQKTYRWRLKYYQYDSNHEEDAIEAVLATIAPLTKSVAVLPHTTAGVYRQTPEEGITESEYIERLVAIGKIDWTKLRRSQGIDEKYCEGPSCEIKYRE